MGKCKDPDGDGSGTCRRIAQIGTRVEESIIAVHKMAHQDRGIDAGGGHDLLEWVGAIGQFLSLSLTFSLPSSEDLARTSHARRPNGELDDEVAPIIRIGCRNPQWSQDIFSQLDVEC